MNLKVLRQCIEVKDSKVSVCQAIVCHGMKELQDYIKFNSIDCLVYTLFLIFFIHSF